jgi:hypothetical protein
LVNSVYATTFNFVISLIARYFKFIAKVCPFLFINTLYYHTAMVGDVNIYMNDPDDLQLAEIEIMIAEQKRYCL